MANRLRMAQVHSIQTLQALGWSQRRIARALGVDRETVARYLRASRGDRQNQPNLPAGSDGLRDSPVAQNQPNPPAGSVGPASQCEPLREVIQGALERGHSAQRIWQDLRAQHNFAGGYDSVKRFCRRMQAGQPPLPFRRMECQPGEEAQIDFGHGAPILTPADPRRPGTKPRRRKTHLFRIVLSCSRKAYSEVVFRQTTEEFLRCLENAFHYFGGVPRTLVPDNLKAAVLQADWYDPELNPKILAFCEHYGTICLPTRPRTPRHKGKVERGVGYAQCNGLKGRTFNSLAEENRFLSDWEITVVDTRIHGTTRKQVGPYFEAIEKPALLPLPLERFPFFHEAQRIVNRDGHVEVAKAYYSAPPEFLGCTVWARWDGRIVRLFDQQLRQIAIHAQLEPGRFATDDKHIVAAKRGGIERGAAWWLRKAHAIGGDTGRWAESVLQQRGIHALRVVMGLVSLAKRHRDAEIERVCRIAHAHGARRLRDIRNLLKRQDPPEQDRFEFIAEHPLIRSLSDYGKLVHSAFEEVHT